MQNIKNTPEYGSLMSQNNPDNETLKRNFFSFLKQNPVYLEQFKQFDQLLSREIELKMENITQQVYESFKDIDVKVQQGKLVYERNGTVTIDGENCTTTVKSVRAGNKRNHPNRDQNINLQLQRNNDSRPILSHRR